MYTPVSVPYTPLHLGHPYCLSLSARLESFSLPPHLHWGSGFRVQGSVFSVQCSVFSVQCSVFGVWGLGSRLSGFGFRASDEGCGV